MDINGRILGKLEEQKQTYSGLPQYLELYRALLLVQIEVGKAILETQPILIRDEVNGRLKKGIPILEWDALPIDWPIYQKLFQQAASIISEHIKLPDKSLKETRFEIPVLQEVAQAWYEGSSLSPWANTHGIAEELLCVIVHCAIKPFLMSQAKAIAPFIEQEQWRRRYCPVCGGNPDLAFLDKEIGARWLLCSRCDTEWLFRRLECPHCGNNKQNDLAYFTDDSGQYRLYTCKVCRVYLKAIDLRHAPADTLMPLERVLTLDMDRQGQEKGFKAGYAAIKPHYQL